jgi:hypothetical protein
MQLSERLDYIGLFTFRRDYRVMDYHSWARKMSLQYDNSYGIGDYHGGEDVDISLLGCNAVVSSR